MTKRRVIGKDNDLPWRISEDLKLFKQHTNGNTIIMGRKTYESIGRPLPNRNNVVISTSMPDTEGLDICRSIEEALQKAKSYNKDIFIIGGAGIYKQFLPYADKMYLSLVKHDYDGDTFFPEFNEQDWKIESEQDYEEFVFRIYSK